MISYRIYPASIIKALLLMPFVMTVHAQQPTATRVNITHGAMVGDVTSTNAVIWSRADSKSLMRVSVRPQADDNTTAIRQVVAVDADHDFAGKLIFKSLRPGTNYDYQVSFLPDKASTLRPSTSIEGHFRTAPDATSESPVRFAWGGDLAGQNVCRDADIGFPIFDILSQAQWIFFIGLGDMIYADGVCKAVGHYGNQQIEGQYTRAATLPNYWAHWKYNRGDPGFQGLLAKTSYVAVWDDHEVVNDSGPLHDTRDQEPYKPGIHLLPIGLSAYLDYNPIEETGITPGRLYRSIRWGRHVELFILDTRQYRDANFKNDDETAPKSMLGREQLTWLKRKLAQSNAIWKVIVSSVPISIPTGIASKSGRDSWANMDHASGFERELAEILAFMRDNGANNNVWLTTDVHFSDGFRYTPFADDPDFQVYEFVAGPLSAALFPNRQFDSSFEAERLFFYGPESASEISTFEQAIPWLSFGAVQVESNGELSIEIVNGVGETVFEKKLKPKTKFTAEPPLADAS